MNQYETFDCLILVNNQFKVSLLPFVLYAIFNQLYVHFLCSIVNSTKHIWTPKEALDSQLWATNGEYITGFGLNPQRHDVIWPQKLVTGLCVGEVGGNWNCLTRDLHLLNLHAACISVWPEVKS